MEKNTRFVLPFLLTVILLCSCGSLVKEKEPNNLPGEAMLLQWEVPVRGHINYEEDRDFFRLPQAASHQTNLLVRISLSAVSNLDLMFDIYRDRELLKRVDGPSTNGPEYMLPLHLEPGRTYHAAVRCTSPFRYNTRQPYDLTVSRMSFNDRAEQEPNDVMARATEIGPEFSVVGFFTPGRNPLRMDYLEEDWYRVLIQQEGLSMRVDVTAVPDQDAVLEVYSESGVLLETANDNPVNESETLVNIGLPAAGYYYICVKDASGNANPFSPYKVIVNLQKPEALSEQEGNDTFQEANDMKPGDRIRGYISPSADADWYRIASPDGLPSIISIHVTAVEKLDFVILAHDQGGTRIQKADNFGEGYPETMIGLYLGEKPLYFCVKSHGNINTEQPYTVLARPAAYTPYKEAEPNERDANGIDTGSLYSGHIGYKGDTDLFHFQVKKKGVYTVLLDSRSRLKMRGELFLSTRSGVIQDRLDFRLRTPLELEKGFYILKISGPEDGFDLENSYLLKISPRIGE